MPEQNKKQEIENNYKEFTKLLPSLLQDKSGQVALMRNGKIVGYYSSIIDALSAGNLAYKDGLFSIQEIKLSEPINLGFFSTNLAS